MVSLSPTWVPTLFLEQLDFDEYPSVPGLFSISNLYRLASHGTAGPFRKKWKQCLDEKMRLTHFNFFGPRTFKEPSFLGYQVFLTFFWGRCVFHLSSIDALDLRNLKPCHPDERLASFGKGLASQITKSPRFFPGYENPQKALLKLPPLPFTSMCNLDSRDTTTPSPYNENPSKSRNTTWDPHGTSCLSIFFGPWRRAVSNMRSSGDFFLQAIWINRITHKHGEHLTFFFGLGGDVDIPCLNQTTKQSDRVSVSARSSNGFTSFTAGKLDDFVVMFTVRVKSLMNTTYSKMPITVLTSWHRDYKW